MRKFNNYFYGLDIIHISVYNVAAYYSIHKKEKWKEPRNPIISRMWGAYTIVRIATNVLKR